MLFMLASMFLMGTGYGLYFALLGLVACLAGSSFATIGVFCFLFGVSVLGYVANTFGYFGFGGDVIVVIGLLLLLSRFNLHTAILKSPAGLLLIAWGVLVLLFFYFTGPQNAYSLALLVGYLRTVFLTFIAFLIIFSDKSVNWTQLGLLGIISALIYLAAAGRVVPDILPSNIFDIGRIRLSAQEMEETGLHPHRLALLACLGFMFIFSRNASKPKNFKDIIILGVTMFMTVVVIGWSGARQGLFLLALGCVSILLCKIEGKFKRYRVPIVAVGLLIFAFMAIGIAKNVAIYSSLFDPNKSIVARLNRTMVFEQAFSQIAEEPLLGHGLGGYRYTAKYQRSMKRTREYAHNVFLDLLVQTGLIGTALFFAPLLLIPNYRRRFGRMRYLIMGNVILPIFVVLLFKNMISGQLFSLGIFIGLIAAMDIVHPPEKRRIAAGAAARPINRLPMRGNGVIGPAKGNSRSD